MMMMMMIMIIINYHCDCYICLFTVRISFRKLYTTVFSVVRLEEACKKDSSNRNYWYKIPLSYVRLVSLRAVLFFLEQQNSISSAITLFILNLLRRQNLPVCYSGIVRSIFVLTLNRFTFINPYSALVGV